MSLNIEKIKPAIGAILHDIHLSELTPKQVHELKNALWTHQVIFLRKQQLTPQLQAKLASYFGSLHIHPIFPSVAGTPEVLILDSLQQDLRDNELWHTDVTFSQTPPLGCVLQAIKIPPTGGDTLWSSGTAAFTALDPALQKKLKTLTATHDIRQSFPLERYAKNAQEREKLEQVFNNNPPVVHPVVRTHPVTGQDILFVSEGFTTRINELDAQESKTLLQFLFKHATQTQFYLRWQWQEGDVAIWDNQCTQHKALFDYGDAHRIMHRATINGSVPYYKKAS